MSICTLCDTSFHSLSNSDVCAATESDILWLGRRGTDHSEMRRDTSLFQCPTELTADVAFVRISDLSGSADHLLHMLDLFADM